MQTKSWYYFVCLKILKLLEIRKINVMLYIPAVGSVVEKKLGS